MFFLFRERPEWNRKGPPVPLWFHKALKKIDPDLVLQYQPPASASCPYGVNPKVYPLGVWDICKRLGTSGLLNPKIVYSLADSKGRFQVPTWRTFHLIRLAYWLHRRRESHRLENELTRWVRESNQARARNDKKALVESLRKYFSKVGQRQWGNRVFLRG